MPHKLIISNSSDFFRIPPENIAFIAAEGNYTRLTIIDGSSYVFSYNLGAFLEIMESQLAEDLSMFSRIGRSHVINNEYVFRIDLSRKELTLAIPSLTRQFKIQASRLALCRAREYFLSQEIRENQFENF